MSDQEAMTGLFAGMNFTLPDYDDRNDYKRMIQKFGGKVKIPSRNAQGSMIHLAPPGIDKNALDLKIRSQEIISTQWVMDCVTHDGILDKSAYVLYRGTQSVPPAPSVLTTAMMSMQNKAGMHGNSRGSQGRGHKRGEKLQAWSAEELRVLIAYARKKKDQFGVSGNKLWELADQENILPGRTMQSMRECAKRKRPIIERDIVNSATRLTKRNTQMLQATVNRLVQDSEQDVDSVCWALYQCNGEFKRARKILYGEITVNDFHPWSSEEDEVITKFSRGIVEAENYSGERAKHVMEAHNVSKDPEATAIEVLLNSRDFHEIAARARYLCSENILQI